MTEADNVENTITSAIVARLKTRSPQTGVFLEEVRAESEFISYPELYRRVLSAAQRFRHDGVGRASRVILPFMTSSECIVAFLALICVGALPLSVKTPSVGANSHEYEEFLQVLISRFGADFVIDVPGLEHLSLPIRRLAVHMHDAQANTDGWFDPTPDDLAFVQFSSGTTSQPKGVPIRHGQLVRQLRMIIAQGDRSASDVGASWLPLYHDMGLVGVLLTPMLLGSIFCLSSPARFLMDPVNWLTTQLGRGVSVLAFPNFGLAYLLRQLSRVDIAAQSVRFDRLRCIYLGSDMIDSAMLEQLTQLLAPYGFSGDVLTPCYGMAEAVLMVSCKQAHTALRTKSQSGVKVVSVGRVLSGFDLKIVTDNGELAKPGESGEIYLRGGTLSPQYFEDERLILDQSGFYHTGDIGFVDGDDLFITGRIGERIKINGQNYYLSHFEGVLQTHPRVRLSGAAVLHSGTDLVVLVEPAGSRSAAALQELRLELARFLLLKTGVKVTPERVIFLRSGQIKRTSSGKLQRNLMHKAWMEQKLLMCAVTPELVR